MTLCKEEWFRLKRTSTALLSRCRELSVPLGHHFGIFLGLAEKTIPTHTARRLAWHRAMGQFGTPAFSAWVAGHRLMASRATDFHVVDYCSRRVQRVLSSPNRRKR